MDVISFGKPKNVIKPEIVDVEREIIKPEVFEPTSEIVDVENEIVFVQHTTKFTYLSITLRGEPAKITRDQAVNGFLDGSIWRVQICNGEIKATVDRFLCEPYPQFQVWDTKIHNIGGYVTPNEAISIAEDNVAKEKNNE